MKLLYIHTVDGKPGYFDGDQIVYAEQGDHWCDDYPTVTAVTNEAQIRDERQKSEAFRLIVTVGESVVIPWDEEKGRRRRSAVQRERKS